MKPSYDQLENQLAETQTRLTETQTRLAETEAKLVKFQELLKLALDRLSVLEEQINKNSKNSSKSPSSDQKANSSNTHKKRKHRNKGINRQLIPLEQVDKFITSSLESCPCCGSPELIDLENPWILQQIDLPEIKAIVTQFIVTKHRCRSCENNSFAELPEGVPDSAFGPKLMGLIAMLTGGLHLSKRDAMQLVRDLFGIDICEGSIINVEERVAAALDESYERIHHHVMQSVFSKHFDETSWRDRGKSHYVWVASTSEASCYHINRRRSREAFQIFVGALGLGSAPVVTDRYAAYNHLEMPHQYCLAHLIRNFRKYAERDGPDSAIGHAIETELRQVCRNHRLFCHDQISRRSRDVRFRHQKKRLDNLLIDGLANGSDELSGLCDRLLDNFSKLWVFSNFTNVEPTNNLAERDLRKIVLWRKKSYGTRSERGQRFVERVTSFIQTVKKAGKNVWVYIRDSVIAYYKGRPAPLISPALGF